MSENNSDSAQQNEKKSFTPVIVLAIIVFGIAGALFWASKNDVSIDKEGSGEEKKEAVIDASNDGEWSYLVGYLMGQQAKVSLNVDEPQNFDKDVMRGVKDAFADDEIRFTEEELGQVIEERLAIDQERADKKAEENKIAGDAFVEEYAQQEGVEKTENGTLYKKLAEGEGDVVGENVALVHYVGKHIDGEEFDSSATHSDEPVPFTSAGIIPGLGEALEIMTVGDKWEIVVPVETAYGVNIQPGSPIEPNEALIFDIEVVEIQPAAAEAEAKTEIQ